MQKAAKQKYARASRIVLADYFVGKKLNGNRPSLLQTSQTILNKLGNDTLPGITNAKVTKLKNLRTTWIGNNKARKDSVSAAQSARAELKTMLKSIEDRKVAIQLAADAEWPHTDKGNAAVAENSVCHPENPFTRERSVGKQARLRKTGRRSGIQGAFAVSGRLLLFA